jgi:hypothetical protein
MPIYEENPLLITRAHIRLFQILPDDSGEDYIRCTFTSVDIAKAPSYRALSYACGPPHPTKTVVVNKEAISVRENLYNFLSALRARGCHDYLWCDCICIDLDNSHERNHQIRLMSQIYRHAKVVYVWIGEQDSTSCETLSTIRSISTDTEPRMKAHCRKNPLKIWTGLASISQRAYWTRIWIVQEMTVAREVEVFCGPESVDLKALAVACKFPPDQLTPWAAELWQLPPGAGTQLQEARRAAGRILHYSTMYNLFRSQRRWPSHVDSFKTLSDQYKTSNCEDSRDRVFALLAISREVILSHGFTVDYTKNMEETFLSLIAWAGSGPVAAFARLRFAQLAASIMGLRWPRYRLEWKIKRVSQRTDKFFGWVSRSLKIAISGRFLGRVVFKKNRRRWIAQIRPELFAHEPIEITLPAHTIVGPSDSSFDIFGFLESRIILACRPSSNTQAWSVVASLGDRDSAADPSRGVRKPRKPQNRVSSIFEGLAVFEHPGPRYELYLENMAQFMEIFLDALPLQALARPEAGKPAVQGAGSLTKLKNENDRGLHEVLGGLKITNPIGLQRTEETKKASPEQSEDDEEEESYEGDHSRLIAESQPLARRRIRKPAVDKPRRDSHSSKRQNDSGCFLDPLCERTIEDEDVQPQDAQSAVRSSKVNHHGILSSDLVGVEEVGGPWIPTPVALWQTV